MFNDTHSFWSGLIPETCDISGKISGARLAISHFITCNHGVSNVTVIYLLLETPSFFQPIYLT